MRGIIAKAKAKSHKSTSSSLILSHLGRTPKNQLENELSRNENVRHSLQRMKKLVESEKDRVFVPRIAYDTVYSRAGQFTDFGSSPYSYGF